MTAAAASPARRPVPTAPRRAWRSRRCRCCPTGGGCPTRRSSSAASPSPTARGAPTPPRCAAR
eukprot:scaffold65883_cov66-Phaeocystis_antarctica.AAC.2